MTAMAMETIVMAAEKTGIMESGDGVYTVAVTEMENLILLVVFAVAVTHSVNEPQCVQWIPKIHIWEPIWQWNHFCVYGPDPFG